jgi:UDP-N-acetylglucosamine 2-epimerase (non-hydrolysing)
LAVVGTRPEAIKLVPVLQKLRAHPDIRLQVVSTAQHRQMLDQVFELFNFRPDVDLDIMRPNQGLNQIVQNAICGLDQVIDEFRPDVVVVQGDTTTAFAAALTAFNKRVEVAHVEAGLRSHDRYNPYPEEVNRTLISHIAAIHFAPTEPSADNLLREGIAESSIYLTGNTVVDCLLQAAHAGRDTLTTFLPRHFRGEGHRLILVTAHRRENQNGAIAELCEAIAGLALMLPQTRFVYPVHMNPNVRKVVFPILSKLPNVALVEPLPYGAFVEAMAAAHLILTDSGGVQEEAPALGKPVLVLRQTTERPEGVIAGAAKVIGTARDRIVSETFSLLSDGDAYERMARCRSPYGDGRASDRTVQGILHHFGLAERPIPFRGGAGVESAA